MINCKNRIFKTLILFSLLLLPTSTEVSAQSNLPGYMKPFGVPLGQPIDPSIKVDRVWDPKPHANWSDYDATYDLIDTLLFDRISPPTPNPLFKNSDWVRDRYTNELGTWNGYLAEVTRKTHTVVIVKAEFYSLADKPWKSGGEIRSCNRMSQVGRYFENSYPDLIVAEVYNKGGEYRWRYKSSAHTGFRLTINCSEDIKDGKKEISAGMSFALNTKSLNDLRDLEALEEQNSGF